MDVGCGTGTLLEMLGEKMPHLHGVGIELNAARAEFARTVTQCEVFQVPVETFEYDGTFDVITMTDVLSHVPSIHDLFATIRRLMPDDGRLILKVGEVTADVKKDAIFDWGIPDHLHFLGMNTLQFICNKYDFRIVRHDRQPLSAELFARTRWTDPGRSVVRNLIKRAVAIVRLEQRG